MMSAAEPGQQDQEEDREATLSEEAGHAAATPPTLQPLAEALAGVGVAGLGVDLAIDPTAIPNAVAGSSYGGYVGADVARKAAGSLNGLLGVPSSA